MRLRFEGRPPPPAEMYFRGPVLTRFDGTEWRPLGLPFAAPGVAARPPILKVQGEPIRYEVTLEPLRLATIPLLEATTGVSAIEGFRVSARDDLQWLTDRQLFERVRFDAEAHTRFVLGAPRRLGELQESLDLPPGYNPRTIAWTRAFRDDPLNRNVGAVVFAQSLLQYIRRAGFSYTLSPGEYGRDGVDEFWLDRKEGFCEHFASAFVVIMRAAGFPARVVTGYQGTDLLPVDGFYLVRQSSAHAWAEYWQTGVGWRRADPTAAVAPDRIERSSRLAPRPGLVAGALDAMSPQLIAQLRSGWEAVNNRWNQWVLNYSRGQQLDVLKNVGFQSPSWEDLALLLIAALSSLALAGAAWAWFDRHRIDPWVRQLERMRRILRSLGLPAAAHEAPRALARRVRERIGAAGEPLAAALDELEAQRYSRASTKRPDAALTRRFRAAARRLKTAPAG
jgi:protein-glutamine gamma-glutamyltransferase